MVIKPRYPRHQRGCISNDWCIKYVSVCFTNSQCSIKSSWKSESEFLLMIHQMMFIHQDLWYGKLVPSSHQSGKSSHTILCTFSRGNNQFWKSIPISNGLREELAFVNISSCSGGLKSQWRWFLQCLNGGIRSSVGMLAAPFRPLFKSMSTVSPLFLEKLPS